MNKITLTLLTPKFIVDNNKVICKLNVKIKNPDLLDRTFLNTKTVKAYATLALTTHIGVAKCHPNDKFDYMKGNKIAYSKAINKAYKLYRHFLKEYEKNLDKIHTNIKENISRFDILVKNETDNLNQLKQQ